MFSTKSITDKDKFVILKGVPRGAILSLTSYNVFNFVVPTLQVKLLPPQYPSRLFVNLDFTAVLLF
jgi:hypothetical protein